MEDFLVCTYVFKVLFLPFVEEIFSKNKLRYVNIGDFPLTLYDISTHCFRENINETYHKSKCHT